ncbi:MAG: hypothetical protein LBU73_01550 [Helicobacteraceae bacterium]|jgi:tetratricopeptide (TPR) repeat protein|nr:hypothetical protein [Helicobacteraceae bacterium]
MDFEFLAIDYRNPAFSVAMLLITIAAISLIDYFLNAARMRRQDKNVERFLTRFSALQNKQYRDLAALGLPPESLIFMAQTAYKSGEFSEAIHIYLAILETTTEAAKKVEIMNALGAAYHKAGFYKRSGDILLESLRLKARNKGALELLLRIYETTREYDLAIEVLESLEELEGAADSRFKEKALLRAGSLIRNRALSDQKREEELLELYAKSPDLFRLILEYFLAKNPEKAWELINPDRLDEALDIFWRINVNIFNAEIAKKYDILFELFSAKGYFAKGEEKSCAKIFEFDILIKLKEYRNSADLEFSYRCPACHASFPAHFYRCPACKSALFAKVETTLVKNEATKDELERNDYEVGANFY